MTDEQRYELYTIEEDREPRRMPWLGIKIGSRVMRRRAVPVEGPNITLDYGDDWHGRVATVAVHEGNSLRITTTMGTGDSVFSAALAEGGLRIPLREGVIEDPALLGKRIGARLVRAESGR